MTRFNPPSASWGESGAALIRPGHTGPEQSRREPARGVSAKPLQQPKICQERQNNVAHMRAWKSSQPSCRTYMTIFSPFLDADERPHCEWRVQLPWRSHPTSGCSCCTLDFHIQRETTHNVVSCRALRFQLCLGVHFLGP